MPIEVFWDEDGREIIQDINLIVDGWTGEVIGKWLGITWVKDPTLGPNDWRLIRK